LRATGASTVDDALLTNSPISLSFARTTLLSTPSSFASSCTRALPATGLLILRPGGDPLDLELLGKRSHRWRFIECSYAVDLLLPTGLRAAARRLRCLPEPYPGRQHADHSECGLARVRNDVLPEPGGIKGARHTQCATERPPPLREVEAAQVKVHRGTATRQPPTRIRDENALDHYDA
jgi:hypothetical protein